MCRSYLHTQGWAEAARHGFYINFKESIPCIEECKSRIAESDSSHKRGQRMVLEGRGLVLSRDWKL